MRRTAAELRTAEHWVYLILDREGFPLYVGSTCNPVRRMRQHIGTGQLDLSEGDRVVYDGPYPDMASARAQESAVIRDLRPDGNFTDNIDQTNRCHMPMGMYDALPALEWAAAEATQEWRDRMRRQYPHLDPWSHLMAGAA